MHINAKYAIYRLLHILHIKLHISAYFKFRCIFFAYSTKTVYIFACFVHISCMLLVYTCIFLAYNILPAYLCIFQAYFVYISCIFDQYSPNNCIFGAYSVHITADLLPLFTQPVHQGRPSRFRSHRKGAGLPHPIRGEGLLYSLRWRWDQ